MYNEYINHGKCYLGTCPSSQGHLNYLCCHDGNYQHNSSERITEQKRLHQKSSCKINDLCISRICVDEYFDDYVELEHITAHTNHSLGVVQLPHLALPKTIQGEVAMNISKDIQAERILKGMSSISKLLSILNHA